jgi:hypothetical protein
MVMVDPLNIIVFEEMKVISKKVIKNRSIYESSNKMKTKIYITFFLIFACAIVHAQIPNSDFENWTSSVSYDIPDSWDNLNSTTAGSSVYTSEKGTPGATGVAGTYFIKLTSKTVTGQGVVPGIAVSGKLNITTLKPISGFAFNQRPANLTGNWQYMVFSAKGVINAGYIDVQLTRWDASMNMRDTIASVHYSLPGMKMSWNAFTLPLTYVDNANYPDSCVITLSASSLTPTNKDFLYVDNLAFSGTQLTTNIVEIRGNKKINVYPNPSTDKISFDLPTTINSEANIQILNLQGEIVKLIKNADATSTLSVDIRDLPTGNYILKVILLNDVFVSRFIKE